MLTLDEAIKHCEEKAKEQRSKAVGYFNGGYSSQIEGKSCLNCAEEHEQLAMWLRELKRYRETNFIPYYSDPTIPPACRACSNHPSNGGSGICHCTLGSGITY